MKYDIIIIGASPGAYRMAKRPGVRTDEQQRIKLPNVYAISEVIREAMFEFNYNP